MVTPARRRKTVRPAGVPATRRAPVGRSARFASVFFRLASETPHGTRGSTRGVLSEPRSVLLTNGRSRSSEHLDGLNGRDRPMPAVAHTAKEGGGLPQIGPAPEFTLTSTDGGRLSLVDLRGKVVAVTFIYATCTDTCPLLTAKMVGLHRRVGQGSAAKGGVVG